MGTGQHQAQATRARWFLGHRGDDGCLGGQLGQRDIECGGEGFQHRHAVHLAHAALDLGDPGHRPVDHPGQLGLGQAPAAPFGGDLAAQGLLIVRGAHPPVPLPVCRVSQSTSVLARYWPRSVEVAAGVRGRLVRLERGLVPVQLIEDPLQRLAVHQVGGVHERSRARRS